MWVCVRRTLTACGWVDPGRVVDDGDPMLDGAEDGAFQRQGGLTVNFVVGGVDPSAVAAAVVEEATAEPGKVRRTSRRAQ